MATEQRWWQPSSTPVAGKQGPPKIGAPAPERNSSKTASFHELPKKRVFGHAPSVETPIQVIVEIKVTQPYPALRAKPSPPEPSIKLFGVERHGNGADLAIRWV